MDKKTANYTDAQTAIIIALANENGGRLNLDLVKTLEGDPRMNDADGNPRNYRSLVAKVSRLVTSGDIAGYDRKQPTTKDGKPIVKKSELVERIAAAAGIAADKLESMDKSAKSALELLAEAVETLREEADAAADDEREAA